MIVMKKLKIIDSLANSKRFNVLLFLVLVSSLTVVLLVKDTPQGLYSDPAGQMKALQQYLAGKSPSSNQIVCPDPDDLSRDAAGWISWWPPGIQLLAYPLMVNGIALGDSLRIITIICFIFGSLGWVKWFSLFGLPLWVQVAFAIVIPWMHYPNNALFLYSAEILSYASAPWILLVTYRLSEKWEQRKYLSAGAIIMHALFGLVIGFCYWLKYSTILISLGVLLFLGLKGFYKRSTNLSSIMPCFVVAVIFFAIPVVSLNFANYKLDGLASPVISRLAINLRWENILFILANPVLAMADAGSLWNYVLLHPAHGILQLLPGAIYGDSGVASGGIVWIGFIGLPGSIFLLWVLTRPSSYGNLQRLALTVFFTGLAAMFATWSLSINGASYEARFIAPISIAILPLVIQKGYYLWRGRSRTVRWLLTLAAIFYIVIPLAYGGISVIGKVMRMPSDYKVGPEHIYDPLLADHNLEGVLDKLMQNVSAYSDIWYLPSSLTALHFSGRAIIVNADFENIDDLRAMRYISSSPLRVRMLLPVHFEKNGKGQVIRGSFIQSDGWKQSKIEGCKYTLWTTTLKVSP